MASAISTPVTSSSRPGRSTRRTSAPGVSPSGTSPTRITRIQEKEDLRHLNDRLANYIERVRQLENEKSSMQLLLEEKSESTSREVGNIRRLYENELADARKTLDNTANERARLQIELSQLAEDHRKLQARNTKKEADLGRAAGHWKSLEAALNSKEAEYANLLAENRNLESAVTDLKNQVSNLEAALQNAQAQLNEEMLQRVDAQNKVQTLKEQIDFQKHMSEQEVREMRTRYESRLVEVDTGRQQEFESKMAEAMQELRKEHEAQIQQYREELERTFIAKLDNAQQAASKNSDVASSVREELATTRTRLESQSSELSHLQRQNTALEARVMELEQTLDRERDVAHQRMSRKEQEMAAMRAQMQAQLEDYQNLLDVKLSLDMEINTYRKMLEGEEQRLKLSPSPSGHGPVPRRHAHGVRRMKGAKRKRESGHSPSYKITQQSSARGSVSIDDIDKEGQYIRLKNNSDMDQPVGGWTVLKSHSVAPEISFQIPSPYILRGGHTLTVWAEEAVEQAPSGDLVLMGHRSWGPVDDVRVLLLTTQNEETAERRLVCVRQRPEGADSDEEFDEEPISGSELHLRRQPKRKKKEKCCLVL
ncbi:lamin L3 isoform X2 [Sardina pilchardus]|uniref:lamin L3 isoform X2 n=1 Tax=Sardina pilchardus TaxID=27697 RepID=UPI002E15059D